jgi:hypothetical protein
VISRLQVALGPGYRFVICSSCGPSPPSRICSGPRSERRYGFLPMTVPKLRSMSTNPTSRIRSSTSL